MSAITQVEMSEGYLALSLLTESPSWRHASAEEGMESWGFMKVTSSDLDKEILTSVVFQCRGWGPPLGCHSLAQIQ